MCRELQHVVVCYDHSNKFFIDSNGSLVDYSSPSFCRLRFNRSSKVYIFTCEMYFKMFQDKVVSLFAVNYVWNKHYVDKTDIGTIKLNGYYRFCSLDETKSGAFSSRVSA